MSLRVVIMFTSAIGRLLWKEYRVQRALWFLLLGLLLVLQILLRLAFFSTTESTSTHISSLDEQWATWAMWFLVFAVQVIFIVASAAISFAGEREERTCDLLVHHAPSPWAILLAKGGICLAGSTALYVCGAFVALLLGRSNPSDNYVTYQIFFAQHSIGSDVALRLTILLVLLAWCMFGSLLSQRVITSIPTMAVGWVLTGWLPMITVLALMNLMPGDFGANMDRFIVMATFALGAVAMLALDTWLGYRWAEGKYLDFRFLADYGDFWSIRRNGVFVRTSRASRIPAGVEPDESESRAWQRLVWQERQRNVIPRWLMILTCTLLLGGNQIDYVIPQDYGIPSLPDVAVCLLALVMGILSFRSEGEGQPIRFLANQGSSPRMIWNARQAVWLVRAFVIPAVLLALVAIRDRSFWTYPTSLIERHFWLILLSYGSGQLAAMLLHRAILAAITGAMATAVLFLWFEFMRSLHIPQWWSAGIPAVAPLIATRMHARCWLLDDSTRAQKLRLSAVLVGLPLLVCAMVATYRVYEVVCFDPAQLSRPVFASANHFQYEYEVGNLSTVASDGSTVRQRLLDIAALPIKPAVGPDTVNFRLNEEERAIADEIARAFASIATIHFRFEPSNHSPSNRKQDANTDRPTSIGRVQLFPVSSFNRLSDRMLARARDHLQLNEPAAALKICLAQLNSCQTMARGPFNSCWQAGADEERRGLELLVEWANRSEVPFAEIHGVIKELEERLKHFPSPGSAIIDEHAQATRNSIVEEYVARHGAILGWQRIWMQLPWESVRRHRLWEIESMLHRAHLSSLFARLNSDPRAGSEERVTHVGGDYLQPMAELQSTTWGAEVALTGDRSDSVRDRFTATRAALTRMGIIAYRKQHQKMPADLDSLFGIVLQRNFQDPWSNGRFDYRSNSLVSQGNSPLPVEVNSKESVPTSSVSPSRFVFPIPPVAESPDR